LIRVRLVLVNLNPINDTYIYKKIMKFMHLKYPNILKQRFPTFGTVITVADNEEDNVEIDSD